jgi:FKBP-type peptidyl-prolyl cis-trans isomerase SlyD
MRVTTGKKVSVQYTLRLEDQTVVESTVGSEPLVYTHGTHEIIPGLEKALEGMAVGETKQVTVAPLEGYGLANPDAVVEVSKHLLPATALRVGAQLQGEGPDGQPVFPRVVAVKDETVILDFNHPLAGKTLYFDITVTNIS